MGEQLITEAEKCLPYYWPEGGVTQIIPYGNGHINDTFLVEMPQRRYILQRMNKHVFLNPPALMENITRVTEHLRGKIEESGGDPERETLNVVRTAAGKPYYLDESGEYWRVYRFVEDTITYDLPDSAETFYRSAVAFGVFQRRLADYPVSALHETIAGFHDTVKRFGHFRQIVAGDPCGRGESARKEIDFFMEREERAGVLLQMLAAGELPLKVTHNDTKLNNILVDRRTGKGLCVIDLDTVMPGLSAYDFGDAIRTGANTGLEDERDLSKVGLDLELFEAYTAGYIEGCQGTLSQAEIKMLPMGAYLMTFEVGLRMLTDYLEGDVYFKIHRDGHNLDRSRTQIKLAADMEVKWDAMAAVVERVGLHQL